MFPLHAVRYRKFSPSFSLAELCSHTFANSSSPVSSCPLLPSQNRHALTSLCFLAFAYSVGVWLKLRKFGAYGSVLDYCGLATLNGLARNGRSLRYTLRKIRRTLNTRLKPCTRSSPAQCKFIYK